AFLVLACNVSCNFPTLVGGTRLIANLPAVAASYVGLEPRPLPSAGVIQPQRCRVGGGALGCPHAGLRPPLKRSMQVSRTPLSQRHATSVGGSKESVRSSVQGPTRRRDGA